MFRPRIIPCLLLKNKGLVKTVKFRNPTYVGDPINAVRIFNDYEADELVFLDITASIEKRLLDIHFIKKIAEEAFMPFAIGGGISSAGDVEMILKAGAEKVVINSSAVINPGLISECSQLFGNQSIIVSIDVGRNFWRKESVCIKDGTVFTGIDPVEHALRMQDAGAGEILINSIERDGTMSGFDINLIKKISSVLSIPVIAIGGAGKLADFKDAVSYGGASAAAAGSMFVFHGAKRAVLINYPDKREMEQIFVE